jgi:endonuclease/exonuclease/phosphatase family metal-dependent hydrolase
MVRGLSSLGVMLVATMVAISGGRSDVSAAATEIVLYASEGIAKGQWAAVATTGAAGSRSMKSADQGFASTNAPLAAPSHYFEMSFDADAATTYRVWLRLRAEGNSKWNDAVWVQFNDSLTTAGSAAYRIGTTSGLMVNLERCSGCGLSNWGWYNSAYWLSQETAVRFAASGRHTIRVQTREDGVEIDQIVLSPVKYLSAAPGPIINDATILAKTSTSTDAPTAPATATLTPYKGTPFALPGTVSAADFDNGGANVAYSDTTAGNSGSAYRTTDVDVQGASIGGYNVGWTIAGEWLKYSVAVATAGNYNVSLRVAAPSGNTVQVTIGGVTASFAVPNTGGWQNWTNVTVPMALAAGTQVMTVKFSTGGVNLHSITVATPSVVSPAPTSGSGGSFRMMTWNIHHGTRKDGVADLAGQVRYIVAQNPHVVVLQEVQTWSENQPSRLKTLLEQGTGVAWTLVWAPVTSAAGTEGNVVLTRLPVRSSATFQMHATSDWTKIGPNRSVAQATVTVGGVPVHVFSTHLDYANTSYRTSQLLDMMEWTAKFGNKRIVGGDFNSWWGEYWITTMMSEYYDTWQDVTGSNQNGYTVNNAVRFDYLFRSKLGSDKVRPTRVSTPVTTLSDHNPVIADYSVVP